MTLPDRTEVLVVGGGLSGLHSAWRLAADGRDVTLVEARDRLGGRVLSQTFDNGAFDLGPAWFWPGQWRMETLVAKLGLTTFAQHDRGDLAFENTDGRVARYPGIAMMGGSLRMAGGLGRMIEALANRLPTDRLHLSHRLTDLRLESNGVIATLVDAKDGEQTLACDRVVLALPPRLVAEGIAFAPTLPDTVLASLSAIPTWMAGHAKLVALYDRPFWRDAGLSGDASSRRGPLMEIHDASPPPTSSEEDGPAALFGFLGIPARHRAGHDAEVLAASRDQLGRLFGPAAADPLDLLYKDWAGDPHTAVAADADPPLSHPAYGLPPACRDPWGGRLVLSGTETARDHGGFLEGALEASENALTALQTPALSRAES